MAVAAVKNWINGVFDSGTNRFTTGHWATDVKATEGMQAALYQQQADSAYNAAVGAVSGAYRDLKDGISTATSNANNTYGAITDNLSGISKDIGNAVSGIAALRGNYQPVYTTLGGIDDDLSQIADNINSFVPGYADEIGDAGRSILGTGTSLIDEGGLFNDQARALMGMDGSGGGLIGAYVDSLNSIDPEKYVSMAATDVQKSYQNAMSQQNRELARSGVDAGSARSVALQQQYAQLMAAASAGAKFRARLQGQNDRLSAIRGAVSDANALAQTGSSITSAGVQAQGTGAGLIGNAANLRLSGEGMKLNVAQGRLGVQNAWLNALSGELQTYNSEINGRNAQANIESAKANVASQQLSAATSAASQQFAAAQAVANAQIAAGKYYNEQATDWGKLAGEGGITRALWG